MVLYPCILRRTALDSLQHRIDESRATGNDNWSPAPGIPSREYFSIMRERVPEPSAADVRLSFRHHVH